MTPIGEIVATRRDGWGRYKIVPPEGGKPVGYTRATTVAKTLDDTGSLLPWKAAMTATGLLRRPGLRASWEALISQHPTTGPWYGGADAKAEVKKLVEQCAEAGGSADRADIGTALHALIEQINLGVTPTITQPDTQADVDAYMAALAAHGLTFDPALIEAVVVLDGYQISGTADMLDAYLPGHGHMVADLKTGADLTYSWPSIRCQLATYANADNVYRFGVNPDGSEDTRHPMPDIRKDVGLVIHLPAGEARCDLYTVDLDHGAQTLHLSMKVRKHRAQRLTADKIAAPSTSVPAVQPPPFDTPSSPGVVSDGGTPAEQRDAVRTNPDEGGPADDVAFDRLQVRYNGLSAKLHTLVTACATEAMQHGVSFHSSGGNRTVRRFEILRGLTCLDDQADGDLLRVILAEIIGDVAHFPTVAVGHLLGSLTADEAARFARRADEGPFTITFTPEGVPVLGVAA